jgi:hypothetical protein
MDIALNVDPVTLFTLVCTRKRSHFPLCIMLHVIPFYQDRLGTNMYTLN